MHKKNILKQILTFVLIGALTMSLLTLTACFKGCSREEEPVLSYVPEKSKLSVMKLAKIKRLLHFVTLFIL